MAGRASSALATRGGADAGEWHDWHEWHMESRGVFFRRKRSSGR